MEHTMNDITDSDGEIGEEFSASLTARSSIMLIVNGAEKQVEIAPWTLLLDLLHEYLDLTGTKKGCDFQCRRLYEQNQHDDCLVEDHHQSQSKRVNSK
jgi:hypothetical protein